jgi:iron complex outermembrane receptor protein
MRPLWALNLSLAIAILVGSAPAAAQQTDEEELALAYGDKATISIATGRKQALNRAPAVATVITSQEIAAMGATDLDQVLETVPGLHVSRLSFADSPIYSFRGIHTQYNPQVLVLINGLPITNIFLGNRSLVAGGMPLDNVARIEILRGPGSAQYGADAYSGVINVITNTAADIKGTEVRARLGNFGTADASIQHAMRVGSADIALFARAGTTDGQKSLIEKDFQAVLDPIFGTRASRSPGPYATFREGVDARADIAWEMWRLRLAAQLRKAGMGAGLADTIDPDSRMPLDKYFADLTYHNPHFAPNWDVSMALGYYSTIEKVGEPPYLLFPPGAFGGQFPNGVIGNPGHSERHWNGSVSAFYAGFDRHRIRVGAGARVEDLYKATEFKNFNLSAIPGIGTVFLPLPAVVEATGALLYMKPHERRLKYLFVQDEWTLATDWTLTAGVRYDRYSDFGSTTNPRLALVWDAAYNVVVKAMHGRAYRAPSFTEQYSQNNPVNFGNPNVKPETINTDEFSLSWQPAASFNANVTLFHYRMEDIIRFVPHADPTTGRTAQNLGAQNGRGMELEASWDASRDVRLVAHYSMQDSTDKISGKNAGLAPRHRIFARADWRIAPAWRFGALANHVAGREREAGDSRPKIKDYTLVDLNLNYDAGHMVELRATVRNLFDRDAREPTFAPGNIPFDLPLPGRAIGLQMILKL